MGLRNGFREIPQKQEKAQPGDVIQYLNNKFVVTGAGNKYYRVRQYDPPYEEGPLIRTTEVIPTGEKAEVRTKPEYPA